MIITDINFLKKTCEKVSIDEGEKIAVKLFDELVKSKIGVGLAANQIGINKRVCIVNVKTSEKYDPIYLINPKIIEKSNEKISYVETCLSFPKQKVRTERHIQVLVKADNLKGKLQFGPEPDEINDLDLLESIVVQHEIDHLNGLTMFDRKFIIKQIINKVKYGRNEKVNIKNIKTDEIIENVKYKKIEDLLNENWEIINSN